MRTQRRSSWAINLVIHPPWLFTRVQMTLKIRHLIPALTAFKRYYIDLAGAKSEPLINKFIIQIKQ